MRTKPIIALFMILLSSCKKEENPFAELEYPLAVAPSTQLPAGSFGWLHQRVFRPTCAVSGCHDGSFEPDFRSIGSSYNSLVYHPVLANDPQLSFIYRVVPGNVQASFLHERLTEFVPNTSGVMPLDLASDSDWPANEAAYLQAVRDWIAGGARDMFGAAPTQGNLQPQVVGIQAYPSGTTAQFYARAEGSGVQPIEVPAGQIDLWFALQDDSTTADALGSNGVKISAFPTAFESVEADPLVFGTGHSAEGIADDVVTYTHKAELDLAGMAAGTLLYVRLYTSDDGVQITEVPNDGTTAPMLNYFTLRIAP
jgi:hypothetical protein